MTLAATLAYFLSKQRDAVGLVAFADRVLEYLPARHRSGHLHRLMMALERTPEGASTDLGKPLNRLAELVSKRGLVVLISDLLTSCDSLERDLGCLRTRGHEVVLFHTLDPAELTFQFDDAALFEDLESGRQLYVDPDAVRKDYLAKLHAHLELVEGVCRRLDIAYRRLSTDVPLESALFDFLRAREESGRAVRRARGKQHA